MSATFELAVIRPVVDAELLRDAVQAAINATGWRRGLSDVTVFAYQLTPDAVVVEHRATSSPRLGADIEVAGAPIHPFARQCRGSSTSTLRWALVLRRRAVER